jgi:soluble lytic murein transglycosylase-like protein
MAFLSCVLVLTPKAEATTPVHTDVETPNAATVVTAVARAAERDLWNDTLLWSNAVWWNRTAAKNAETVTRTRKDRGPGRRSLLAVSAPSGNCGGTLPPCWIMMRESRGNIRAMNPSGAAGKWQIMPGTWHAFMGYASAADAPEWVQDAKARTMAICNWTPPAYCAR